MWSLEEVSTAFNYSAMLTGSHLMRPLFSMEPLDLSAFLLSLEVMGILSWILDLSSAAFALFAFQFWDELNPFFSYGFPCAIMIGKAFPTFTF